MRTWCSRALAPTRGVWTSVPTENPVRATGDVSRPGQDRHAPAAGGECHVDLDLRDALSQLGVPTVAVVHILNSVQRAAPKRHLSLARIHERMSWEVSKAVRGNC